MQKETDCEFAHLRPVSYLSVVLHLLSTREGIK